MFLLESGSFLIVFFYTKERAVYVLMHNAINVSILRQMIKSCFEAILKWPVHVSGSSWFHHLIVWNPTHPLIWNEAIDHCWTGNWVVRTEDSLPSLLLLQHGEHREATWLANEKYCWV
jgi:hypothetical protein